VDKLPLLKRPFMTAGVTNVPYLPLRGTDKNMEVDYVYND